VNAGSPQTQRSPNQRSPNNPVQRTLTDTASTVSTSVRRVFDSGAKIMSRRNKNQATSPTVQQDDAFAAIQQDPDATSMTVNTPSVNTPDGSNSGNTAEQGYGAVDVLREASFLSDFGALASQASQVSQNSHAETNTILEFSPIGNQVASPGRSDVASGINLNALPRQNSPRDNVAVTGMDLLDTPNATASNDGVTGTLIPAPSPRRSTQSPETHQLQQTLRNNATEQVLRYDYASPTSSNNGGNATSAFFTFGANDRPITVETVKENSDDGDEWPEGDGLAGNTAGENVEVNSAPSTSKADDEAGMAYDSSMAMGVASTSSNAGKNLVINTSDPGRGDFVITVGALGNASGTPLDGSHNMSFGENVAGEGRIVDSAAKSAASRVSWFNRMGNGSGVKADDETDVRLQI